MKKIFFATMLTLTSVATHAAETQWLKTPFWRAPQVSNMNVKFKMLNSELAGACDSYHRLIAMAERQVEIPNISRRVDRWRKTPLINSPMNVYDFQVYFEMNESVIDRTIDLSAQSFIDLNKDSLPFYTQTLATTSIDVAEAESFSIEPIGQKNALINFSRRVGLSDSEIVVEGNKLKVLGLDVACDLYEGNVVLSTVVNSSVSLGQKQVKDLEAFYHKSLTPELNRILSLNSDSQISKAARLGFQMSRLLEEELQQKDSEVVEKNIKGLMDVLFVPKTLDASANLIEISKKKVVNLVSSTDGLPVSVSFSME